MLKCNCLNLLILRLILDSYYDNDDIIIINNNNINNNNNNKGIINLSFQYNTQTSNTESYDTYPSGLPFLLSHFARELLLVVYRGFGVVNWVKVNC